MKADPRTKYDFCKIMADITKFPIGKLLKETKYWPHSWFFDVQSLCKEKTKEQQAKTINWFIRESHIK